jgi:hypothetical protein
MAPFKVYQLNEFDYDGTPFPDEAPDITDISTTLDKTIALIDRLRQTNTIKVRKLFHKTKVHRSISVHKT